MIRGDNYKVYTLNDPRTGFIRYVGITKFPLQTRLNHHKWDRNKCRKKHWFSKLVSQGLMPKISLLEDNLTTDVAVRKEIMYIKMFKALGYDLVNTANGGEGVGGMKLTVEQKKFLSKRPQHFHKGHTPWNKGKKNCFSEETLQLMREVHKGTSIGKSNPYYGRKHSKEVREKISKSHEGRVVTEEWKNNIRKAHLGEKSHRAKLKEADIINIRNLYTSGGITYLQLSKMYNLTIAAIGLIVRRKNWSHI